MPSPQLLVRRPEAPTTDSWSPAGWRTLPIAQQPTWPDRDELDAVADYLSGLPALTEVAEIRRLREDIARASAGEAFVLQAGDCAEPLGMAATTSARAKHRAITALGERLARELRRPTIGVGRLAGQFAKPRSEPFEAVDGQLLPVFRGLMVNEPEATAAARQADPYRLLSCYYTARQVVAELSAAGGGVRTSHEVLILEYEQALTRLDEASGEWFLRSTHLPWVGERTRAVDGAHLNFLAGLGNPVAVKVGPSATVDEVLRICALLDPHRRPGRLTLISRMGHRKIADHLPSLVRAVADAGHPVAWMCDAMHGNTVRGAGGVKTRHLDTIVDELTTFVEVLRSHGREPAGLHLEIAADDVTECVGAGVVDESQLGRAYRSLCDPRLNHEQADAVVDALVTAMHR
ncbi:MULTISPECIES: 3-deoxy-7-phosphoheptulonate synthase [Micromonospora]|uniref:Phospho-2-dehydro-3-deoxyheptonate aldolase n=1 Tax=Micromonospora humida TaxID=2809018 RepID=A0ABS2ILG7_9ACTN|nr:3-deoxy-7-phosphoheptulonate synthase [Micromonospora humida]MBM7075203.1 3-deoxy-7-phosphoheptulonate synthase [Micromonospora humida]